MPPCCSSLNWGVQCFRLGGREGDGPLSSQRVNSTEFETGREAERRVLLFLGVITLLVLLYLFLHGLWEIYQPGGQCQMSNYLVRLYTGLHLYTPHYYCD